MKVRRMAGNGACFVSAVILALLFTGCSKDSSVDPGPEATPIVTIGSQVWMLKNLDVDHYRNGDPIPQATDPTAWKALTTGAWCWYNNDPAMGVIYGKLYNWHAVNDPRGLAPAGWHVAADSEWTSLTAFLVETGAGGRLKEAGTAHWLDPNVEASNSSGFTALPGGWRAASGTFEGLKFIGV